MSYFHLLGLVIGVPALICSIAYLIWLAEEQGR